jgi:hypothetical protein
MIYFSSLIEKITAGHVPSNNPAVITPNLAARLAADKAYIIHLNLGNLLPYRIEFGAFILNIKILILAFFRPNLKWFCFSLVLPTQYSRKFENFLLVLLQLIAIDG